MHRRGCRQLLLLSVLAASCFVALCASRTYVQIIGTPHIGDTLRERQAANDEWENGKEPFRPAEVLEALVARRHWSRTLEWHIENYTNFYGDPDPGWWVKFDSLGPITPLCRQTEIFSGGDSEKRACGISKMPAPCKIISIGSHNEWGFEEAIVARTNCTVDTFDCTGKGKGWAVPSAIAHRVVLHEKCIGGAEGVKAGSQDFITWQTLLQLAGMTDAAPTYLKMDIEGWEYDVLRSMLESPHHLPQQIALELHYHNWEESNTGMAWKDRDKTFGEIAAFMDMLWRFGHYYVVDKHDNGSCPACTEILLVRFPPEHSMLRGGEEQQPDVAGHGAAAAVGRR